MTDQHETEQPYIPHVEVLEQLSPDDLDDFVRLLPQLSSTPRSRGDIEVNLQNALASPTTRVFIIRDESGRIQSSATGNKCPIPTGFKAWVDDVVTDQSHRGKGYGEMVTAAIEDWLAESGITSVNLTSNFDRQSAGDLYERMGYKQRPTRVYRKAMLGHTALGLM